MRAWVWGLLAFAWLWAGPGMAAPEASPAPAANLPLDAFFKKPAFSGPQLSPDGKHLAMVKREGDGWVLAVYDLAAHTAVGVMSVTDKHHEFSWLHWKGDGRLVVGTTYLNIKRRGDREDGGILGWSFGQMLFAVDRDGANKALLIKADNGDAQRTDDALKLLDALDKDPDHVLVVATDYDGRDLVKKIDIHTAAAELVEPADDRNLGWDTDVNGAVIARYELIGSNLLVQGRAPGAKDWTEVARMRVKDWAKESKDFELLGATDKPGALYVAVKAKPGDADQTRRLYIYDFRTNSLGPPVWPSTGYDIAAIVRDQRTGALDGVCYWVDTFVCDYRSDEVNRNMRALSKVFQGERNLIPVSFWQDSKGWLFSVTGPTEKESYYLYDWAARRVQFLGTRHPELPEGRLATVERYPYPAADGATIPAYLTRPPGAPKGPLPLIVMPHGGPEARDGVDFDLYAQVLATRGYLVFQPNFRGSGGYGAAYAAAGYGQWGGRMQTDVTDGVKRLIATGQADPARICIVGASYGGYAALIAGAQNPELYKCVVSRAGIADLVTTLKWERDTHGGDSETYKYWKTSMGDPDKDRARMLAASPVSFAAHYGPPVLLLHGLEDRIVPVEQSREMERVLKAAGRSVKLSTYKEEGHSGWSDLHEQAALQEIVDFVTGHIAPAVVGASAAVAGK